MNRSNLLAGIEDFFAYVLWQPDTTTSWWVRGTVAALSIFVLLLVCHRLALKKWVGKSLTLLVMAVSLMGWAVSWAAVQHAIQGRIDSKWEPVVLVATAMLVLLAMVAPFTRLCYRSGYWAGVASWMLAVLLTEGLLYLLVRILAV
jgi:hypothetical protein